MYLYLTLVHNKMNLCQKLFPFFHVFNWGFPLLVVLPLLIAGILGYSYIAVSTWCFIGGNMVWKSAVYVMVGGKLWEILTYVLIIILYILIKRHISIQVSILHTLF